MSTQLFNMVRTYLAYIQPIALGSRYIIGVKLQNNNLHIKRNIIY